MGEEWTPKEIQAFFQDEPFDFEPGTGWRYDNSGYILLGEILEKVTGRPYADLVAETIFRPLGMVNTRYGSDAPIIPNRVAGYQRTPKGAVNARFVSMTQPFAAGALVSTVDDLAKWHAALDVGRILSPESRRRMWTPVRLPDGRDTRYGFGWMIWSREGNRVVEHGGSIHGFQTANLRLPDDRIYVAVLSNCGGCADPRALALSAATLLAGRPWAERPAVALPAATLDRYVGRYRDSEGDVWQVDREDDHLVVTAGRTWKAWPSSDDAFFFRDAVREVRFVVNPGGAVTAMEVDDFAGPVETTKRITTTP
jgi:D-alanyl-D-alanine carboxypeptidase